ncbi:MAG: two component transcriptional regulator, LuxR family [Acidimicrobiales bacterium]|nr:two component transcriptional regulator, LuxR family [Acidimicrobiales bacterium]
MPIRVFLVDDHELVRLGLRDAVSAEDDLDVVGEASNAADAIVRIPEADPDVAVFDVRLGDAEKDGISVCRQVRAANPDIQCLMLTSYPGDEALFGSIMAGASGYLLKEIPVADLLAALRRVAVGESLIDPAMTTRVLERIRMPVAVDPIRERRPLTPQERNILQLIAEGKTNREIADDMGLAEKTVKYYVSNLLSKLGMHRRSQAAAYAARLTERARG